MKAYLPKVSVIIPSYNHESYIASALQSIADQSYKNIELIVIDDASTDRTADVTANHIRSLGNRFPACRFVVNEQNFGASATINRGVHLSSGEWVTVLNSDDLFVPERIQKLVDAAGLDCDFVFSAVSPINAHGSAVDGSQLALKVAYGPSQIIGSLRSTSSALVQWNVCVTTGNMFFKKTLFDKLQGFRPLRYTHDWDFALRSCFFYRAEVC